jgi:hypothetical protein
VVIMNEYIRGFIFSEDTVVCPHCATKEETKHVTQEELIMEFQLNDGFRFFCDRCQKEILPLTNMEEEW